MTIEPPPDNPNHDPDTTEESMMSNPKIGTHIQKVKEQIGEKDTEKDRHQIDTTKMGDSRICGYITHGFSSPPTDHYKSNSNANPNRSSVTPSTFFSKSSFALSYRSSKPPLAYRLMDPSTETIYAMLGIGAGEFPGPSPIVACASTRTIISRQI